MKALSIDFRNRRKGKLGRHLIQAPQRIADPYVLTHHYFSFVGQKGPDNINLPWMDVKDRRH